MSKYNYSSEQRTMNTNSHTTTSMKELASLWISFYIVHGHLSVFLFHFFTFDNCSISKSNWSTEQTPWYASNLAKSNNWWDCFLPAVLLCWGSGVNVLLRCLRLPYSLSPFYMRPRELEGGPFVLFTASPTLSSTNHWGQKRGVK